MCNLQFSRSFLKDKLDVRLSVHDLFNNIDNVSKTINAYGRTESWSNMITRYAMLHIAYRFTQQPKKKIKNKIINNNLSKLRAIKSYKDLFVAKLKQKPHVEVSDTDSGIIFGYDCENLYKMVQNSNRLFSQN